MTWFALAAIAAIGALLIWRFLDRAPEAAPRFDAFERPACSHCDADAECYRPIAREVRPLVGVLSWLVPIGLVASRFRVVDATWERPNLCRSHYSLARSALEAALASEALELARYLEGRASRLVSFQSAVLSRVLRRSGAAKELPS